ncbi:Superoxide dismutase [Lentibacillus sp. JNUCC-1]|uniref:superoxide dismutase family protein n=1 Tax=Lentibacillus sp. JNUCC-1 TaxID=2654513 RepID=UPI0012E7494B|nr:superoxide dismutase family protein [Lentibacillus sp. JNUCC-1]MUV38182.1 Superoxide dismutase [Lentibacillus sp. JNUCC-1]
MKRLLFLSIIFITTVALAACGGNTEDNSSDTQGNTDQADANSEQTDQNNGDSDESKQESDGDTVEVDLNNGDGDSVGTAMLEEKSDGVLVTLEGENLPKGTHAFHIHEKGQCEAPDFKSAGGHFNPEDTNHGYDDPEGPHAGDMPNIVVGEDGTVTQSFLAKDVTLEEGDDLSLMKEEGTSLVIHEGADDGKSQPSGDAGDRLACGSISE